MPPLGLLHVSSALKDLPFVRNHIIDAGGQGMTVADAADRVVALEPDVLGVSILSTDVQRGLMLLRRVKELRPSVTTVLGGAHATMFDEQLLKEVPELDMVLRGEADRSFGELCARLNGGEDITGVPGLSHRSNGAVNRGTPVIIQDLDALPFVDWSAVELGLYYHWWGDVPLWKHYKYVSLLTSRGCPFHCTFCSRITPELGEWRFRTAESVFQEIVQLSEKGFTHIVIPDENFTRSITRVEKLSQMLVDRDLNIRFMADGSIHHLSPPTLTLMRRAGFDVISVGVESGSDEQLKRFRKPANSRALAAGIKRAKKANFVVHSFFIVGGPGEQPADHEASKEFIREVGPHSAGFIEMTVFPGSQVWDELMGPNRSLAESSPRKIHEFEGQVDEATITVRRNELIGALVKSWLRWRRVGETIRLFLYNPFFRQWIIGAIRNLPRMIKLVKILRKSVDPSQEKFTALLKFKGGWFLSRGGKREKRTPVDR